MSKKLLYQGPDISKHQGVVNVKKIRDAGYKRIGIRAGYGKNNIDQQFVNNATACVNLGVHVMLYWFSYALSVAMAKAEAQYCIAQAKKYWTKCPIAFDLEYDTIRYARTKGVEINKKMATDMAIAFLKEVRDAGYIPVIYTNRDYAKNYFDLLRITKEVGQVYVWWALYSNSIPEGELNVADVWQFTSKARIPGVSGNVDMNNFYTDFDDALPTVPVQSKPTPNINILNFQKAANLDGYRDASGKKLVEDGIDGAKTQYVRRNIVLKAKWTPLGYKVGSKGHVVAWFQRRCNEMLGSSQDVDLLYGATSRKECLKVQEKLLLTKDGIAGYNTLQALFYN